MMQTKQPPKVQWDPETEAMALATALLAWRYRLGVRTADTPEDQGKYRAVVLSHAVALLPFKGHFPRIYRDAAVSLLEAGGDK